MTASRANGRDHVLTIEGAGTRGDCRAAEAHRPGDAVLVMIRPEDVTLGSARRRTARWPGKVVDGVFRGPRRTLTVETSGPPLHRRMPGDARGRGRRHRDPEVERRQRLGAEALDGALARAGCAEARGERLRAGLPRGLRARAARDRAPSTSSSSHMTLSDVARATDLPKPSVRRALYTLTCLGMAAERRPHLPADAQDHGAGLGLSRLQHGLDHRPAGLRAPRRPHRAVVLRRRARRPRHRA